MNRKKSRNAVEEEKSKIAVSLYLSSETIEKIDECLFSAKRRLPIDKRAKVSKSAFCEIALRIAIEEYDRKGEESALWKGIYELFGE